MKTIIVTCLFTSVIFLIIDLIWLSYMVKNFYRPNLGSLLTDKPVMWAAILFYLVYVLGLSIIILMPAINNDSIYQAFWNGIIFGVVAYGTYNFTNMATVKNWSANVVFVDVMWGGILTGTSSALGIYLTKKFIS